MATTNVPAVTFSTAGAYLPNETEILSGLMADIDAAFGHDITTPQGLLAQSLAAIIGNSNNNIGSTASCTR